LLRVSSDAGNQEAKFVSGNSWSLPNWGDKTGDGIADTDTGSGEGFKYSVPTGPAYLYFYFDEITNEYLAGVMPSTDANADGLPDAWARWHGVSGALADHDGDGRPNITEMRLGMNPTQASGTQPLTNFPGMSLAGSFVNGWNESGARMTLVDDYQWRIDRDIGNSSNQAFKFNIGNWTTQWGEKVNKAFTGRAEGSEDIALPNLGSGRYRFVFNEATLEFSVSKLGNYTQRYGGTPVNQVRPVTGLAALSEYLFGGSAASPPPPSNLPMMSLANGRMRIEFVARVDDDKLTHAVQTTTNLSGGWSEAGVVLISEAAQGGPSSGLRKMVYEVQAAGAPQRFFRIRSTRQP
jgi:hypothetical protein